MRHITLLRARVGTRIQVVGGLVLLGRVLIVRVLELVQVVTGRRHVWRVVEVPEELVADVDRAVVVMEEAEEGAEVEEEDAEVGVESSSWIYFVIALNGLV